jgi:hypothetical protein
MHLFLLIQDAWHAKSWKDKFRIWFMPLGWRPENVIQEYPIYKIEDVYHFEHYKKEASPSLRYYLWGQLISLLLIVSYLYSHIASIGSPNIFIYGAFIFVHIYALTDLMDGNSKVWILETIKNVACVLWIVKTGDWFGSSDLSPWITPALVVYFAVNTLIVFSFCQSTRALSPSK